MSRFGNLLNNHPTPAPEPVAEEPVVEVPTAEDDLEEVALESDVSIGEMSKRELEAYGRTVGIELDRRHSRKRLVQELEDYLTDS